MGTTLGPRCGQDVGRGGLSPRGKRQNRWWLQVRDDFAVWHAQGTGSAGILWADEIGLGPGLLIDAAAGSTDFA